MSWRAMGPRKGYARGFKSPSHIWVANGDDANDEGWIAFMVPNEDLAIRIANGLNVDAQLAGASPELGNALVGFMLWAKRGHPAGIIEVMDVAQAALIKAGWIVKEH